MTASLRASTLPLRRLEPAVSVGSTARGPVKAQVASVDDRSSIGEATVNSPAGPEADFRAGPLGDDVCMNVGHCKTATVTTMSCSTSTATPPTTFSGTHLPAVAPASLPEAVVGFSNGSGALLHSHCQPLGLDEFGPAVSTTSSPTEA
ncbi:unnamed protein product [Protopolystoma xenopodis]|uniref:Uncharacterized protein n=1 Tax=Protopolystoma xenopodis TaxID=117903 RepID=A0A448WG97_9PLAT|nr:unnamed protein product [Protopolystoma xenopodis]